MAIRPTGPRPLRGLQLCSVDFTARTFMRPIIDRFRVEGIDTRVGCAPSVFTPVLQSLGYPMEALPMRRGLNPLAQARALWAVWRYLRREDIDILHVHTPIAALVGRLAARLAGTPLVFYTAHGFLFHEEMAGWKRRFHIGLERLAARWTDFIFTCSDEDRQTAVAEGICPANRIKTILNGIDLDRFDPARFDAEARAAIRRDLGIPSAAQVVMISGRLVREKGYFEFFEALAGCMDGAPDVWGLVLGDVLENEHDDAKRDLMAFVDRLGIRERIVFAGMRDDMPEMLAAGDVFVLPSYREGMPYSILEAMAMETPVVATNIRGCREEVVDGETGYLVPTRDVVALRERMKQLLSDRDEARTLGRAGRARVRALFRESMTVDKQWVEIERLLVEKGLARVVDHE